MLPSKQVGLLLSALTVSLNSSAQVVSFGFHLNPTLNTPIPDAPNYLSREIRLVPLRPGYKYGIQSTITSDRASIELGLSAVGKSFTLRQTDFSPADLRGRPVRFVARGTSVEPSLLVRYAVVEHTGRSVYSVQVLAGVSRELHFMRVPDERDRVDTVRGGTYTAASYYTAFDQSGHPRTNVIAGAQIRTVLRKLGLVEYGLALHFPTESTGPYRMETTVTEQQQQTTKRYYAEFYPYLAYLDFRLRYYIYSFRHGEGRVRYRE